MRRMLNLLCLIAVLVLAMMAVTTAMAATRPSIGIRMSASQPLNLVRVYVSSDWQNPGFYTYTNGVETFHSIAGLIDASISRNGRGIAYIVGDAIYVYDLRSGRIRTVAGKLRAPRTIAWSWDSRSLIFSLEEDFFDDFGPYTEWQLYRISAFGDSTPERISTPLNPNLVTEHQVTITGLSRNIRYYINIISTTGTTS